MVLKANRDELIFHILFSQPDFEDGERAVGHPPLIRHEKWQNSSLTGLRRSTFYR